jgi:hypothetical protein
MPRGMTLPGMVFFKEGVICLVEISKNHMQSFGVEAFQTVLS